MRAHTELQKGISIDSIIHTSRYSRNIVRHLMNQRVHKSVFQKATKQHFWILNQISSWQIIQQWNLSRAVLAAKAALWLCKLVTKKARIKCLATLSKPWFLQNAICGLAANNGLITSDLSPDIQNMSGVKWWVPFSSASWNCIRASVHTIPWLSQWCKWH